MWNHKFLPPQVLDGRGELPPRGSAVRKEGFADRGALRSKEDTVHVEAVVVVGDQGEAAVGVPASDHAFRQSAQVRIRNHG